MAKKTAVKKVSKKLPKKSALKAEPRRTSADMETSGALVDALFLGLGLALLTQAVERLSSAVDEALQPEKPKAAKVLPKKVTPPTKVTKARQAKTLKSAKGTK